tara:strand:+ start:533 stop:907 length:375 start_codon:yes stop_codon:yes gene_type:complete
MRLKFNDTLEIIGNSLMKTLSEIENYGETPELKAEMLYKYGRVHFLQNNFEKAYKVFEQCNIHIIDNNLPQNIEIYYWVGRISEETKKNEKARSAYLITLEQMKDKNDEEFMNEILDRISNLKI